MIDLGLDEPDYDAFVHIIKAAAVGLIRSTTPDGETLPNDADVPGFLPKAVGIAAAPRKIHYFSPFFRISTTVAEEVLRAAMNRIARVVSYPKGLTS